uniref:Uncharacterized protein n=1 Tax=Oryza barthii TaxID=65489 RepID=A0A0D3GUL8_9ORYZ
MDWIHIISMQSLAVTPSSGKVSAMVATRPRRVPTTEVQGLELRVLVLHYDAEKFPPPPPRMAQKSVTF